MRVEGKALQRTSAGISAVGLLVVSLRPWEWVKNGFLFSALFFSENLLNAELLAKSLLAFGLFCLAAGGAYLINDIWDRYQDEKHPRKRMRPIASGALPVALAAPVAVIFCIVAVAGAFF